MKHVVHDNVSAYNYHCLQTHITNDINHINGASFPNQNMTHQQKNKDPNPKHTNLQRKKIICYRISNHQK